MFKIGYRTVKTAVGTALAVWIAQLLHLEFSSTAGILVILCVQNTKRKSLEVSIHRFVACLLSLVFAFFTFESIGYTPLALGVLLLLFIPSAVMLKIQEGIVTSAVIVMHLYSLQKITWSIVGNEVAILTVGISVALLINLYMPSVESELEAYQRKVESNFKTILLEMAAYLRNRESVWNGKELIETVTLLGRAKEVSFIKLENQFMREDDYYYRYFQMRQQQFEILERVMPLAASLSWSYEQAGMVADVIENVGNAIRPGSTGVISLRQLQEMKEIFREMRLPETREEFETRAKLVQLVYEIEQFILIKSQFIGKYNIKELI